MDQEELKFKSLAAIYGIDSVTKLNRAHVCIIGIGGVGSWAAESLVRSGVGEITLIDLDEICESNTNRQIHTNIETYGKSKILEMKDRIQLINPSCKVNIIEDFLTEKTVDLYINHNKKYSYLIDAIDGLNSKCAIINKCYKEKIKMATIGGAGGKKNPALIQTNDLNKSYDDRILYLVRKKLRKEFEFPKNKENYNIDCVFSPEKITVSNINIEGSQKLNCQGRLGSLAHVTGVFGLYASSLALESILNNE